MYVKIEPSGCCERKGMVQVRFCMYLDQGDYGYEKHHVQNSDTLKWQDNPFHNHFIQVEPDAADNEILDIGVECLKEAYTDWKANRKPNPKNKPYILPVLTNARITACQDKVKHLKEVILERLV